MNTENATPAEMKALHVHLAQQGGQKCKGKQWDPLMALGSHQDVNTTIDFKQYYENWVSNLENTGLKQNAGIYMSELERYLLYYRTKGVAFSFSRNFPYAVNFAFRDLRLLRDKPSNKNIGGFCIWRN